MTKRAVILAGGKGTRLRPYTTVLPKPLMPVGEYTILEIVIRQLVHYGFEHITIAVNHQAELIKAFFKDGSKWNVVIDYSMENEPLGTMGPLQLIEDLPDHFLVMNGDILTDLDFSEFYQQHANNNHFFTISSHQRKQLIDYGVLMVNEEGSLQGFQEKPTTKYDVSMGIYMVSRDVLDFVPHSTLYGFDDLVLGLLKAGKPVKAKMFDGYWLDIGRPDDYIQATETFEDMKERFLRG